MKAPKSKSLLTVLITAVLLMSFSISQAQKIDARALTIKEIHDYELPEDTQTSGGLLTVGIDEAVYLEAQVPTGTVVSGVAWSVDSAPEGSTAALQESPILDSMPIFSPGDRTVAEVADRQMFVPDVDGQYMIKAVVTTADGPLELEALVTGARYVGSGIVDGASPVYPECALCHPGNAVGYAETGHATFLQEAIDGIKSSHYNEGCIGCHALGLNPSAENGSFFDVANQVGWTFPEVLEEGNWDAMPDELKAKANIQCEHCHGPGSEHHGIKSATSVSLNSGDCAQCHDDEPYHVKNLQWNLSRHAVATRYPTGENRGSCVRCHSGIGFIEEIDGVAEKSTDYEAIVCAACHDPHSAENEHQVRTLADVTLENDHVVTEGGTGKLCMNCHKARRNAVEYVQGNVSSHYGPHYGIQGDLFNGTNAIEYDGKVSGGASAHLYATENACATCHMQGTASSDPFNNMAGGHTFKMAWDNDTPDDHHDDVPLTAVCVDCHGPTDTFDLPRSDYNLDGVTEGLQTEVHHMLEVLALLLHPVGSPDVVRGDSDHEYTDKEKKALYNYMCVEEDGSHGMHNPSYITAILKASIEDMANPFLDILGGMNVPVGGEWFYSWFEYYSPQADGWVYHFEHGHISIAGDADNIYFYEDNTGKWRYTNESLYPVIYDLESSQYMYYSGKWKDMRHFYLYDTGEWIIIE